MQPGWLKAHAGKVLFLNITHALSEDQWAECLTEAQRHKVELHLHAPFASLIPAYLNPSLERDEQTLLPAWDRQQDHHTSVIVSDDADATTATITQNAPGAWQVLDVSECLASDLLNSLQGTFNEGSFAFTERTGALIQALDAGQSVLLTGMFSKDLADELARLLLSRINSENHPGRLLMVTPHREAFAFVPQSEHKVSPGEKQALLGLDRLEDIGGDEALASTPFVQLQAGYDFIKKHPGQNVHQSWEGMESLPGRVPPLPFDADHSQAQALAFHEARLRAVESRLTNAPFVFLTGLTGVGKTTFVRESLSKKHIVHYGEAALEKWATDTPKDDQRIILFIDEANLDGRQWSEFEGLFHAPKTLLVNGQILTLSSQHCVVFAGNPINYGDDRSLPSLFARHGNALVLEPLPPACIYQDILKPIFPTTLSDADTIAFCQPMLEVYQFLCKLSVDDVLITPRELQMMALLLMYSEESPSLLRAKDIARDIASHALPSQHRQAFEARFPKPEPLKHADEKLLNDFIITPSRQPVVKLMKQMLALRHARTTTLELNDAQCYGGLGGLIFEGEPGIGKSDFVKKFLLSHDYQPGVLQSETPSSGNTYYSIPVSMGLEEKKAALIKAFHEGAVVLIDEINSSPMMERLLNDLLMGIGPNSERPKHPGFMVIGTQNPITMAGRQAPSTALSRRMITCVMPEYPADELQRILHAVTGIPLDDAMSMVKAFQKQSETAKARHLTPAPCFRDLLNLAKQKARGLLPSYTPKEPSIPAPAPAPEGDTPQGNGTKKDTLIALLGSYLKEREDIKDASGTKTKEYFYGSFFSASQKSFTQKKRLFLHYNPS
jgi:hypothetical protein